MAKLASTEAIPVRGAREAQEDIWGGCTVGIDQASGLGAQLWMPIGSTFHLWRNDDFLNFPDKSFRRYEVEYYTGNLRAVWKSFWALHRGTRMPARWNADGSHPKVEVEYLEGFLPVLIEGQGTFTPRVDRVIMEYHRKADTGQDEDRVFVFFSYADQSSGSGVQPMEDGAASGPPR